MKYFNMADRPPKIQQRIDEVSCPVDGFYRNYAKKQIRSLETVSLY